MTASARCTESANWRNAIARLSMRKTRLDRQASSESVNRRQARARLSTLNTHLDRQASSESIFDRRAKTLCFVSGDAGDAFRSTSVMRERFVQHAASKCCSGSSLGHMFGSPSVPI